MTKMKNIVPLLVLGIAGCLQQPHKPDNSETLQASSSKGQSQQTAASKDAYSNVKDENTLTPNTGSIAAAQPQFELAGFKNPIIASGADPWVVEKDGWYYNCYSNGNAQISVRKSRKLNEIEKAKIARVWNAPEGKPYSQQTWAPELHFIQGKWYIYFTADDGKNSNHRMFVLESKTDDAMGEYTLKGQIQTDNWAIDGTVLELKDKLYFIWSGWSALAQKQQALYIAPMKDPWTLVDKASFHQTIEAESTKINRASIKQSSDASGGKVVAQIDYADSSLTFTVKAPKAGSYALDIIYGAGFEGGATDWIAVNGGTAKKIVLPAMGWENRQVMTAKIELKAGDNSIEVKKGDGYAELDAFIVKDYGRDPVMISVPEHDWERKGGPDYVNEGPEVLKNAKMNKTMVIYSASGSWTNDYCLGQLTLNSDDPMSSQAWDKLPTPVFQASGDVYGPGHASFVKTVDGAQDWIVYHAAKAKDSGWSRNVRTQKFDWNADGRPNFGKPKPLSEELSIPYQKD